jgi:hypothetical protein
MSGPDEEFDDFLARRKPLFRRAPDDVLEPPEEVDRLVLRQAREAIETRRPQRAIRGTQWGAPLAVAATLLVALTVVLHGALPRKPQPVPEVTVQQVAQQREYPPPPAAAAPASPVPSPQTAADAAESDAVVVDLAPSASAARAAAPQPAERAMAKASSTPDWRRDSQSWLAHIEQLRAEGKNAEADAEMGEYKRQHRAYAVGPGR